MSINKNAIKSALISTMIIGLFGGLGMVSARADPPANHANSQSQSAVFAIENMTCALCPVTIKKAMSRVDGVQSVKVDFETKTATVRFDPAQTSLAAIATASTNVGYPAKPANTQDP